MSRCMFDTGEYCEYLTDGMREDEPAQPCNVPHHRENCIYYREDKIPDPVEEILRQYADEKDEEPIRLIDDSGREVEE